MTGFFQRIKQGLTKTSSRLTTGLKDIFKSGKLDDKALEDMEELLIMADIDVETSADLVETLKKQKFQGDKPLTEQVNHFMGEHIESILKEVEKPFHINKSHQPHVILMTGVNGSGKTTTIGKLASIWQKEGLKVMVAACDTFRAAAVEQLQAWCDRLHVPLIKGAPNQEPASVAYDALEKAQAAQADVLLIDTAGRLQNKQHLMEELSKIQRVMGKQIQEAPHDVLLVLDGTVGQNAHAQVQAFSKAVKITGLIMTKLDGTTKAGILVALTKKYALPLYYIGVGEKVDDLCPFNAQDFATALFKDDIVT